MSRCEIDKAVQPRAKLETERLGETFRLRSATVIGQYFLTASLLADTDPNLYCPCIRSLEGGWKRPPDFHLVRLNVLVFLRLLDFSGFPFFQVKPIHVSLTPNPTRLIELTFTSYTHGQQRPSRGCP